MQRKGFRLLRSCTAALRRIECSSLNLRGVRGESEFARLSREYFVALLKDENCNADTRRPRRDTFEELRANGMARSRTEGHGETE